MRIVSVFLVLLFFLSFTGCDQLSEPYKTPTLYSYMVLPHTTDDSIKSSTVHHYAFVDTRISQSGKLLVFLGSTGSLPQSYASLNKVATKLGYYVINLSYLNTVDGQACAAQNDVNCFANYHEEMLFGNDKSSLVVVNKYNSISNRLLKLLQLLHKVNPSNGWDKFYKDTELIYSKIVLSGHAQGGGHAAYLAQKFEADRLVLFSAPTDYSDVLAQPAPWCQQDFATPADRFYGLTHRRDDVLPVAKQHSIWKRMGLLENADTTSADTPGFESSSALVTNFEPNVNAKTPPLYRNLPAQEYALPAGNDRKQLKEVWKYLLGNSER